MDDKNRQRMGIGRISPAGYRWPEFSPDFRKQWHQELQRLLGGHSGGKVFKVAQYPDGFRSDVHFWSEMRIWAAMAKAYADLGGDAVQGLAGALLKASGGDTADKRILDALLAARDTPEVIALALAGVADMRDRIGAEPSAWAKEHAAAAGISPEQAEKFAAERDYSNWPGAKAQ
jgi:hypothetical protein